MMKTQEEETGGPRHIGALKWYSREMNTWINSAWLSSYRFSAAEGMSSSLAKLGRILLLQVPRTVQNVFKCQIHAFLADSKLEAGIKPEWDELKEEAQPLQQQFKLRSSVSLSRHDLLHLSLKGKHSIGKYSVSLNGISRMRQPQDLCL